MHKKQQAPRKKQQTSQPFSLYGMLDLEKDSSVSTQDIKKQYRKLVFKYHPDKNKQDPQARQKFQKLKQAYDILTDPEKRKIYDQTGSIDGTDQAAFQSAYQYYRSIYKKVTKQDIQSFEKRYRGSAEQQEDLTDFYNRKGGNMVELLESIPLSREEDIQRFMEFYEQKFQEKQLKKTKKFTETKNKVRLLPDEQQQWQDLQEQQKKQKKSQMDKLVLAIRSNSDNRQKNFLASLQEKYGGNNNKKNGAEDKKPSKKRKLNK